LSSESAPTAAPAIDESISEIVVDDVVVPKPKPRKPRAKPEPVTVVVQAKRKVTRFPAVWSAELRARKVPLVSAEPKRKISTRLPSAWAARLRANADKPIVLQRPLQIPEQPIECDVNTKRIVEAILFAANKPMTIKQIQAAFPELERPDTLEIQLALEAIAQDYLIRPIGLKQLASGYRFQVKEGMAPWVTRLFEEKPARYSRALLETLSIIAYRQPATRGEIEDIRGVGVSSSIIHTLLEREWIRVIAHKEVPGRPALYGTTKQFLDYFNLTSLSQLPTLDEIADFDFSHEQPQEHRERSQTELTETVQTEFRATEQETEADSQTEADSGAENRTLH
jgi:segregation and condensation protein B